MKKSIYSKILAARNLTESTYVIRLEKNEFEFKSGQYLVLNVPGEYKSREYSIYSPEDASYIDLLIKEIDNGEISKELKYLKIGTKVKITGPFGFFYLQDNEPIENKHFTFIATGTGIAPFHSIILSNPKLNYEVIHGVRHGYEAYDSSDYPEDRYMLCTSREHGIHFFGRVTHYLKKMGIKKNSIYYICGNSGMINDVTDYLAQNGICSENIRTEVFF